MKHHVDFKGQACGWHPAVLLRKIAHVTAKEAGRFGLHLHPGDGGAPGFGGHVMFLSHLVSRLCPLSGLGW